MVVNCAGRTRSIIGAQSLINAGVPNKVVALRNGTMGWSLAGFTCDSGKNRRAPGVSEQTLDWARRSGAARGASSCGVERHRSRAHSSAGATDADAHALSVRCARSRPNTQAGHLPGAISAPGGQLVQATDQYVGTLGARIVLVDDAEVRAVMTGVVAAADGLARRVRAGCSRQQRPAGRQLRCSDPRLRGRSGASMLAELGELLARDGATVVDLSLSRDYLRSAHSGRLVCDPHAA